MVSYIIRRLFAAIGVVIVISMITFAIFFLIPRIAGATPESMAARYVGKSPNPAQLHAAAESLGFYDPVAVQYWDWFKGVFVGKDVLTGTGVDHCPAPCLGYSYKTSQPVLPEIQKRFPVTLSLAVGAAIIWLVMGIAIGVLSALKRDGNSTEVLFLSAFMEAELAYTTVAEGARGYLSKESSRQEICDAIVSVSRGDTALAPEVQSALAQEIMDRERTHGRPELSPRESEVLLLIAEGLSAPDIAKQIHLSPTTVKTHLGTLYEKLGVSDRAAAVAEGMRRGLLE